LFGFTALSVAFLATIAGIAAAYLISAKFAKRLAISSPEKPEERTLGEDAPISP
jgi:flagellar motor component MotA